MYEKVTHCCVDELFNFEAVYLAKRKLFMFGNFVSIKTHILCVLLIIVLVLNCSIVSQRN